MGRTLRFLKVKKRTTRTKTNWRSTYQTRNKNKNKKCLKKQGTKGKPAEMIANGGDKLEEEEEVFIAEVWKKEVMAHRWKEATNYLCNK